MNDYDMMEDAHEVAIIPPPAEEPEENVAAPAGPRADDHEFMMSKYLEPLTDLESLAEGHYTWKIDNWKHLQRRVHSEPFEVGGIPWQILLFPYGNNCDQASLYLEHGLGENVPDKWYACAQFTIVLWNKEDPAIFTSHTATHRFNNVEGDWGFTRFVDIRALYAPNWEGMGRPMIEGDCVNCTAYVRLYKDPTGVLWHNFVNYDSKTETGMVGIKNQGATCYLNSLIQSLYFTNAFRKAVYQIPTEEDDQANTSAWALQRLFHLLQTHELAVSTSELTHSFGWETRHIFEQQDVQELNRVLMDRMEERMKGTEAEGVLAKMFVGKMKTYISCIHVDYESSRLEEFWDLQLNVSGNKNLDDSFKDYIQVETMDGDNKYFAEGHGLQEAKKGVIFESFPQVLHLQLKRFEYDIHRDAMMKVNDRYEFSESFDAAPYLAPEVDKSEPWVYRLHSVLVHSGDLTAGHYYAFIRPDKDGDFYKFDDDRVTRATKKEALEENFGGEYTNGTVRNPYTRTLSTKRSMSAYMLVYVRESRIDSILSLDLKDTTPAHIARQLEEEQIALERRRKEREEQHLYQHCAVITEDNFRSYQGFDLTDWDAPTEDPAAPLQYRVKKTLTISAFTEQIATDLKVPSKSLRLWMVVGRQNKTQRPDSLIVETEKSIDETNMRHLGKDRVFRVFAETAVPDSNGIPQWPESMANGTAQPPIILFVKYFDVDAQTLLGMGHISLHKQSLVSDCIPLILKLFGDKPPGFSDITLFEEIKHAMIEEMKLKATLHNAELQDGDIIAFQRVVSREEAITIAQSGRIAGVREFYDYLLNRTEIQMYPRFTNAGSEPFTVTLSRRNTYDQLASKVAEKLNVDPTHLRFSTVASTGKLKAFIKRNPALNVHQIMNPQVSSYGVAQRPDALFFEVLEMSLAELELKKAIRVTWVTEGISKEEQVDLLVPKAGTVSDILTELKKKAALDDEAVQSTQLYTVHSGKIIKELALTTSIGSLIEYNSICAQLLPHEELSAPDTDKPIFAFHFDKDTARTHGVPFRFHLKPGETLEEMKVRLSKRINLKGKQFDNIKMTLVSKAPYSKPRLLENDDVVSDLVQADDLLGLDHVNKTKPALAKGDSMFIR